MPMTEEKKGEGREFYFDIDTDIVTSGSQTLRKHCHDHFEIYFITKGSCCYFINDKAYHLVPGDIILIPDGIMHNTKYQNTVYSRKLISCSEYFIPDSVRAHIPSLIHLYRNPEVTDSIDEVFRKIEEEYGCGDEFCEDMLKCYTNMLFLIMARNPVKCDKEENSRHYVDDAIDYIQSNFTHNITLPMLSERYFVSPEHFSRVFKRRTGFTFVEYLNALRLQKAESMLKQLNTAPITQIAEECGFNDSNYFSLKFKELYGMPPKRFQTMNKGAVKKTEI